MYDARKLWIPKSLYHLEISRRLDISDVIKLIVHVFLCMMTYVKTILFIIICYSMYWYWCILDVTNKHFIIRFFTFLALSKLFDSMSFSFIVLLQHLIFRRKDQLHLKIMVLKHQYRLLRGCSFVDTLGILYLRYKQRIIP